MSREISSSFYSGQLSHCSPSFPPYYKFELPVPGIELTKITKISKPHRLIKIFSLNSPQCYPESQTNEECRRVVTITAKVNILYISQNLNNMNNDDPPTPTTDRNDGKDCLKNEHISRFYERMELLMKLHL